MFCYAIAPKVHHKIGDNPTRLHDVAGSGHTYAGFVESPGLTLDLDHLGCREGVDTCRSFSLLGVQTK
jgi:hypothetical protein